jgi:hypothetical protein
VNSRIQIGLAAGVLLSCGATAGAQVIDAGQVNRTYSGLYAYYDAGEGVDVDGGGFVTTWYNLAETKAEPWLQDLYNIIGFPWQDDSAVNGLPAIDYDGISGTWAPRDEFGEVHQPNTYFVVSKVTLACPEFSGYLWDSSTSGSRIACLFSPSANPCNYTLYAGTEYHSTVAVVENEFQIHTIVANGTETSHYINGELAYTGDIGDGYQWGLILGMRYSGNNGLEGQIAEFILYDELLGGGNRGNVEQYLSTKYDIALGGGGDCYADYNGDGNVNTQDFLAYLGAWSAAFQSGNYDAAADCNDDGSINTQDFLCFLGLWAAGC